MPNGVGHEVYAQRLYVEAAAERTMEWQIVKLFYTAVHLLNYVIYRGGDADDRVMNHVQRELDMSRDARLKNELVEYRQLRHHSEVARYKPFLPPLTRGQVMVHAGYVAHLFSVAGVAVPSLTVPDFSCAPSSLAAP